MNEKAKERNAERARVAWIGLNGYAEEKSQKNDDGFQRAVLEEFEWLTDMLTDLRHMARVRGLDFDAASRLATDHFTAEVDEETEPSICPKCGGYADGGWTDGLCTRCHDKAVEP